MSEHLRIQVQTYLEIYDPLGMAGLAAPEVLYASVAPEVVSALEQATDPEALAQAVHRVLYLSYGTQAGHPRDYQELARELWRLKAQGAG
ncbi:DUF1871 family protein [Calidithermus timidus]|jgi:hypothetical protein|uniref:DUF1871 family protein n=1 Tax=Calidithermus timidus TaxID=307124 RepID=UPI0003793F1E|nr:DUF1871 family protein [Calidithermus timidus]